MHVLSSSLPPLPNTPAFATGRRSAVPRSESLQQSSIAKALGHWEPWCPVSQGGGLFLCFFFFLTLKRKLAPLLQDTAALKPNKLLPRNAQNKAVPIRDHGGASSGAEFPARGERAA